MKRWYWHASVRQPNTSQTDLENILGDYAALYKWDDPSILDRHVPTPVIQFKIDYEKPIEGEIVAAVRRMRSNREGVNSHMQEEHLPTWLRETYPALTLTVPPKPNRWLKLLERIQLIWENGSIPTELGCNMLVLTPKGKTDTRGNRILEVVWKVAEEGINTWITTVLQFHHVLNRFCAGKGAGTAILELKLAQELASVDQDPLLLVLLDLRKAYDNLDW